MPRRRMRREPLTQKEVAKIIQLSQHGVSLVDIAARFDTSYANIKVIMARKRNSTDGQEGIPQG